jgi:hypothetical protein
VSVVDVSPGDDDADARALEPVLTRLRDLGLVDVDALLAGVAADDYRTLLVAYRDDLVDALCLARDRGRELAERLTGDPLQLLDAGPATRARDGGREAAARAAQQLQRRAAACRAMARLDDLVARVYPQLFDADRRIGSGG